MKFKPLEVMKALAGAFKMMVKRQKAEDVAGLMEEYDATEENRIGITVVDPDERMVLCKFWVMVTDEGLDWGWDFEPGQVDIAATTTFSTILNIAAGEARFENPDTGKLEMKRFTAWDAIRTGKVRIKGDGAFMGYQRLIRFLDDFSPELQKILRKVRAPS